VPSKNILAALYASRALLVLAYLAGAAHRMDLLPVRDRPRLHLARDRSADRVNRRQAVRHPLPRDPVRADAAVAPGRRISSARGSAAIAITHQGSYQWMWVADIVLAGFAALVNLAIREPRSGAASAGASMRNVLQMLAVTNARERVCGRAHISPRPQAGQRVHPKRAAVQPVPQAVNRDGQCHIARSRRATA
jgi:hypothetical protein